MEESSKINNLSTPIAIVIAGALIAGALYLGTSQSGGTNSPQPQVGTEQPAGSLEKVAAVTSEDHIRGNPNADVVIVEYSDFECPFCK